MQRNHIYILARALALLFSTVVAIAPSIAGADESGFFMGFDGGGAFRFGSSHTTHAGAGFGGGGKVVGRAGKKAGGGEAGPGNQAEKNNEEQGLDQGGNPEASKLRSVVDEKIAVAEQYRRCRQNLRH